MSERFLEAVRQPAMEGLRTDYVQMVGPRDDLGRVCPRRIASPVDEIETAIEAVVGGPCMNRHVVWFQPMPAEDQGVIDEDPECVLTTADVGTIGRKFVLLIADKAQELVIGVGIHDAK